MVRYFHVSALCMVALSTLCTPPVGWAQTPPFSCSAKEEADVAAHSVYVNAFVALAKQDVENVEAHADTDAAKETLRKIRQIDPQVFVFSQDDERSLRKMVTQKLCTDLSREQRTLLETFYSAPGGRERVIEQLRLYSTLITASQTMMRENIIKTQLTH